MYFEHMHPVVLLLYLSGVLILTMFTMNPLIIGISFLCSLILEICLAGRAAVKKNLYIQIPVFIFTAVIQPMFSHSGTTALYYINDSKVTLEAYVYGLAAGFLLAAVIQWCACMQYLLPSDKLLYLFGKISPTMGLMFSMIFRFIPLLQNRYSQIHEAQKCLYQDKGLWEKCRGMVRELSVLISWSLESSIETSDSMTARGYGLKGRSSYTVFVWKKKDKRAAFFIIIMFLIVLTAIIAKCFTIYYLPIIYIRHWSGFTAAATVCFAVLGTFPVVLEILRKGQKNNG